MPRQGERRLPPEVAALLRDLEAEIASNTDERVRHILAKAGEQIRELQQSVDNAWENWEGILQPLCDYAVSQDDYSTDDMRDDGGPEEVGASYIALLEARKKKADELENELRSSQAEKDSYEECLRAVCSQLELPQSESGPADDPRLYEKAIESLDVNLKLAEQAVLEQKRSRFAAEAELHRIKLTGSITNCAELRLDWNEYEREGDPDEWDAETPFGTFYRIGYQGGEFRAVHGSVEIGSFPTPEEAKDACALDCVRRMNSIFAEPSPGVRP